MNYKRDFAGKYMGERVRERGRNDAWFCPLSLSLSPTAIAAKRFQIESSERDVCGGEGTSGVKRTKSATSKLTLRVMT